MNANSDIDLPHQNEALFTLLLEKTATKFITLSSTTNCLFRDLFTRILDCILVQLLPQ